MREKYIDEEFLITEMKTTTRDGEPRSWLLHAVRGEDVIEDCGRVEAAAFLGAYDRLLDYARRLAERAPDAAYDVLEEMRHERERKEGE